MRHDDLLVTMALFSLPSGEILLVNKCGQEPHKHKSHKTSIAGCGMACDLKSWVEQNSKGE